jgi:hypothetical protein
VLELNRRPASDERSVTVSRANHDQKRNGPEKQKEMPVRTSRKIPPFIGECSLRLKDVSNCSVKTLQLCRGPGDVHARIQAYQVEGIQGGKNSSENLRILFERYKTQNPEMSPEMSGLLKYQYIEGVQLERLSRSVRLACCDVGNVDRSERKLQDPQNGPSEGI